MGGKSASFRPVQEAYEGRLLPGFLEWVAGSLELLHGSTACPDSPGKGRLVHLKAMR